jgi:hypothetical protein
MTASHLIICRKSLLPIKTVFSSISQINYDHSLILSWISALLEKLPIVELLKNFPAFYGTYRFITMFTRAIHWSLS